MSNIRPPEYGVKKDELTLTTQDPASVLYGVTPDNKWIPVKVSDTGALMIGGSITLDVGDLEIGAVEIKNYNTDDRAYVSPAHEVLAQARLYDGSGTALTSTLLSGKQSLDVNIASASGITLDHSTSNILVYGNDGSTDRKVKTNASGELQVGITNASIPVTQSGTWNINNVSGTISLPTGASTEATLLAVKTDLDKFTFLGGSVNSNITNATLAVTQSGVWTTGRTWTLASGTDSISSVQSGAWTVTSNIGTTGGLALDNTLTSGSQKSQVINSSGVPVDARAIGGTPVDTDIGLVTNSIIYGHTTAGGGSYVEVKVTPSGAILADVSGSNISISNTPLAVTQSGTWNINNVSGTVSLPTGASTEVTLAAVKTQTDKLTFTATRLLVDGSGVTQPVKISQVGTDNNVDAIDRVAREIGRVSASDSVIVSESFSTAVNTYATARPVNGDMVVRHYKTKKIYVKNTSANAGRLQIFGSVDNGSNFDVTVVPDQAVNAGVTSITDLTDALTHLQIQVRSQNNGQTTTWVSKAYAMGV